MHKRQLKRTLESLNLSLVDFENATGNSGNLVLRAPDGATGKFMVSRLDDPGSDRINTQQMRKFAREHSGSQTLPGVVELDIVLLDVTPKPPSDVDLASMAVAYGSDAEFNRKLGRRLAKDGPYDTRNAVASTVSMAPPPPPPPPPPAPKPATFENIERLIAQKSERQKSKTMPRKNPLTLATPTMTTTPTPEPKPRKTVDRIGQVEFFKLCTILTKMDLTGISSLTKLAEKLTVAYGSAIATTTTQDALKATGRKLDKVRAENATEAQMIIAKTLTALLIKLNEPVPEELRALCGDIE